MEKSKNKPFYVVVKYYPQEDGTFRPILPLEGPCRGEGLQCVLGVKDWRERSTGPEFPLCVMCCKSHQVCFTLYPPGHVRYGRQPWVDLSPSGKVITPQRGPPFTGTYFQAAIDGDKGRAWPKESREGSQAPRFETQRRHLARCCKLFSIDNETMMEIAAEVLRVAGMVLNQAQRWLKTRKGYRIMASCVTSVLKQLAPSIQTFQGLASCGYYAGMWPPIQWWDELAGCFRGIPFRAFG